MTLRRGSWRHLSRVVGGLVAVLAAGCGSGTTSSDAPSAEPRYEITANVVEEGAGPVICLGGAGTAQSPGCYGPAVVGIDWATLDHEDHGTFREGTYRLVGTWDGSALILTEPPSASEPADETSSDDGHPDFSPPCPEPEGGWPSAPVTFEEWQAFPVRIQEPPDYAGSWVDQQTTVADPTKDVTTIAYTGDPEIHRAEIEAFWPNPICVIQHPRALAELLEIGEAITGPAATAGELDGLFPLGSGIDEVRGLVRISVFLATPEAQAAFDERYGPGVVELSGMVRLVD